MFTFVVWAVGLYIIFRVVMFLVAILGDFVDFAVVKRIFWVCVGLYFVYFFWHFLSQPPNP